MTADVWFEEQLKELEDDPDFLTEQVLLGVTEQLYVRMEEAGLRPSDLAERLGVSRAYISQLFNGKPNMTMRTLVAVAYALDVRVHIWLYPKIGQSMSSAGALEPVPVTVSEDPNAVAFAA